MNDFFFPKVNKRKHTSLKVQLKRGHLTLNQLERVQGTIGSWQYASCRRLCLFHPGLLREVAAEMCPPQRSLLPQLCTQIL